MHAELGGITLLLGVALSRYLGFSLGFEFGFRTLRQVKLSLQIRGSHRYCGCYNGLLAEDPFGVNPHPESLNLLSDAASAAILQPFAEFELGEEVLHHEGDFLLRSESHGCVSSPPACPCLARLEAEHHPA